MKQSFYCLLVVLVFCSCKNNKTKADRIIHNAVIYTVDSAFTVAEAMAIGNGRILATGSSAEILANYFSDSIIDLEKKAVFPGFIDAHCHFYGYGLGLDELDLVGTKSFDEVLLRLIEYSKTHPSKPGREEWIIGRGWDQNDWDIKEYPDRRKIDSLFSDRPVFLKRIDGHAALANSEALRRGNITVKTKVSGGELGFLKVPRLQLPRWEMPDPNAGLSGILIDNAVDLVEKVIPLPSRSQVKEALLSAQKNCVGAGLTTVDDAGLMKDIVDMIDSLHKSGDLKMRVYAMLSDSAPNYEYYLKNGTYKTDRLNVRSFKFYGDGALGSRGACLTEDYSDKPGWKGFLLKSPSYYREKADIIGRTDFQVNMHCIGDSAYRVFFQISNGNINNIIESDNFNPKELDRRWRIEHAQIIDTSVMYSVYNYREGEKMFVGVIPSVQPTHATSDMYWAEERIGKDRVGFAYAYKTLLKKAGIIALGTDFPVEDISAIKTFYAAVFRKDSNGYPEGGFQIEEALTREEAIRGMTIWAAYANFEEKEKGSLEPGKFADFVVLDTDLMKAPENKILSAKVLHTFINGENVFVREYAEIKK